MAKTDSDPANSILQIVGLTAYEPYTYYYTPSRFNKPHMVDREIKEYEGYLYIRGYFYRKSAIDNLFQPFKGLHFYQVLEVLDGPAGCAEHNIDADDMKMRMYNFDNGRHMTNIVVPDPRTYHILTTIRNREMTQVFEAMREANKQKREKDRAPVVELVKTLALDYELGVPTVRKILANSGALPSGAGQRTQPLRKLRPEDQYFVGVYDKLALDARSYYTKGAGKYIGGRRLSDDEGMENFSIEAALLFKLGSDGFIELPRHCAITGRKFNQASLEGKKGRDWELDDIVIGRVDRNKPAHKDNLVFMTRMTRSALEYDQSMVAHNSPWKRLQCTQQEWQNAINDAHRSKV